MTAVQRATVRILRPLVGIFLRMKFGYTWTRAEGLPDNYIVLSNHSTDFDPLMVYMSFDRPMYFVASEHISRWGFAYKLLKIFFDPILRYKGSVASRTVKEILQKVRQGENVCFFAAGNRTWDGAPCPILPSTGKLVQKSKCGLVTYRLEGGFFADPRWREGGTTRKGRVHGGPVNVYTPEQLAAMTADEINGIICRDLGEDAYARQTADPVPYKGRRLAEGLENLAYICPFCGDVDSLCSYDETVECVHCGRTFRYNSYGMLEDAPFSHLGELSLWQEGETRRAAAEGRGYTSDRGELVTVAEGKVTPVSMGRVSLTAEALSCGSVEIPLSSITELDIHGKHRVVFTAGRQYYELTPSGSALKFVTLYRCLTQTAEAAASVR